jgi:hypothetical protein
MPILNVFRRGRDGIYHFWGSELLYVPHEPGQQSATTICSTPSGTCSTLRPRDEAISNPSSTTRRAF